MIPILVQLGFTASLIAGLATGVGALPILFTRDISNRTLGIMLGFSAGVMLAATSFSLLVPSIDLGGIWVAVGGLLIGVIFLVAIEYVIPHFQSKNEESEGSKRISRIWLFIFAITLHNFPEGIAVGVSFGSSDIATGFLVATAIGLQNFPEGLAVALPLVGEGKSRIRALGYATLTGLIEPVGGLLGAGVVTIFQQLLPWGLAFAAGAMLLVVAGDIIPESQKNGFARQAVLALIVGFTIMMFLDSVLA
ncbi:MAG: ZIP family metal transporter [Promethearchaeota archaeon]